MRGDATSIYRWLADAILIVHASFVVFVVAGLFLILLGGALGWDWVRSVRFRIAHLLAIVFVVAQAWVERICPLTIWENALREAAGEHGYAGGFIRHWLEKLLYYNFEPRVFAVAYTLFGALVALAWLLVPPGRHRRGETPDDRIGPAGGDPRAEGGGAEEL